MICNSGVGLTPTIDGEVHQFSAGGLYDGLILLIDDETRSYWDHITGEAVHGPSKGARLEAWALEMTTVRSARSNDPELPVAVSKLGLLKAAAGRVQIGMAGRERGFLPPRFRGTMGEPDARRGEMDMGLGVIVDGRARYYPMELLRRSAPLEERWGERTILITVDADKIPSAVWPDGSRPMQLFTRWYGFSYTYPRCEIAS